MIKNHVPLVLHLAVVFSCSR